jgi:hypothetical protein
MQYLKSYKKKIKILQLFPHIFFFFYKKQILQRSRNKTKPSMCGKIKPVLREKGSKLPIQKSSRPTCFLCHPQIVPAELSQEQQEK